MNELFSVWCSEYTARAVFGAYILISYIAFIIHYETWVSIVKRGKANAWLIIPFYAVLPWMILFALLNIAMEWMLSKIRRHLSDSLLGGNERGDGNGSKGD